MNENWRRFLLVGGVVGTIIGLMFAVAHFVHKYFTVALIWVIGLICGGILARLVSTETGSVWVALVALLLAAFLISRFLKRINR